jgi:serine phosphatase RsbU (regulator of sigma subunit)
MVSITTVLAVVGSIAGAMSAAIVWLARALVQEHAGRLADAVSAKAAYDLRVEKHLEDVRSAGQILTEHQKNVLPLIAELSVHFQTANERAEQRRRRPDSDPPERHSAADDTLTEVRRALERGGVPQVPVQGKGNRP